MSDLLALIFISSPLLLTGLVGFLLQRGLRNSQQICWRWVALSIALAACVGGILGLLASFGRLAPVFAFFMAGLVCVGVLISSVWIAWTVSGWRKLGGLLFLLLAPPGFWLSMDYGDTLSLEMQTQRHGDIIIEQLEQYYHRQGAYPSALTDLVPEYLSDLPEALTTQDTGWLYTANTDSYVFGYWYWPDKEATMVCKYSSAQRAWKCTGVSNAEGWKPFPIVLTPGPTQYTLPTATRRPLSIPLQPTKPRPTSSPIPSPTARPDVPETRCPEPVETPFDAASCVDRQIQQDRLYASWTSRECLMVIMEESSADGFTIAIREDHEPPCPGDPNVAPIVDRFRVTPDGRILWLDYDSPEYIAYQYVVLWRLR